MRKYIGGAFVWQPFGARRPRINRWLPPVGYTQAIDLRRDGQRGAQTAGQKNFAIFAGPPGTATPSGYTDLGTGTLREIAMGQARRQALATAVGLKATPEGNDLADVLRWLFTVGADPTGIDSLRPIALDRHGRWQCRFAGERLALPQFRLDKPIGAALRDQLTRTLKTWRDAARSGKLVSPATAQVDADYHRRLAKSLLEKYRGVQLADVKPADWTAGETLLRHDTTIADDFNRANSATLGTASGGFAWAEIAAFSDATISSNQIRESAATAGGYARAAADLSSADHFAEARIKDLGSAKYLELCVRFATEAQMVTYGAESNSLDGDMLYLVKWSDDSTITGLGSVAGALQVDDVLRCEVEGSTLRLKVNGAEMDTATDSSYPSALRSGIGLYDSAADDFLAGDLAAAVPDRFTNLVASLRRRRRFTLLGGSS